MGGLQSTVIVHKPVEPGAVLLAALHLLGHPHVTSRVHDYGANRMLLGQTGGVPAYVSVHFRRDAGWYTTGQDGRPPGHVLATFGTPHWQRKRFRLPPDPQAREEHARLVAALGAWLDERERVWWWRFDAEPWKVAMSGVLYSRGGPPDTWSGSPGNPDEL